MKHRFILFVAFFACAVFGIAQESTINSSATQPISSPVAYVYVSQAVGLTYQIVGYSADSTGKLTAIPGSPFSGSVQWIALNGKWLFGTDNFTFIRSFSIASNGALQEVSSINAGSYNPSGTGGPENVFLDHTGSTLYDGDINEDGMGNTAYQSFTIDQNTGQLNFQALTSTANSIRGLPLTFTGGNVYAYSSGFYNNGTRGIYGDKRNADGTLTDLNINPAIPAGPNGATYCPDLGAADPTNHVAVVLTPMDSLCAASKGPSQLAVYTQGSSGNLTTTSTSSNMPKTLTNGVNDLWMSPSGRLLAVGGSNGLQVFHFNGAKPITHYTGLLTTEPIDQLFWDNANHLYAISRQFGALFVFTVTPTGYSQAPGSPYTIVANQNLIVLPK